MLFRLFRRLIFSVCPFENINRPISIVMQFTKFLPILFNFVRRYLVMLTVDVMLINSRATLRKKEHIFIRVVFLTK